MDKKYEIIYVEKPEESAWGIIGGGLQKYNIEQAGDNNFQRLCFALQTPENEIVGGVLGEVYWGWLYVDLLWIQDELRGQWIWTSSFDSIEDEARKLGARNAYLDTFSFQVPDFYKDHGYQVFGELPDFPPGHQRYFMKKEL